MVEWCDPGFEGCLERMGKGRVEGARAVVELDVWEVGLIGFLVFLLSSCIFLACFFVLRFAVYVSPFLGRC